MLNKKFTSEDPKSAVDMESDTGEFEKESSLDSPVETNAENEITPLEIQMLDDAGINESSDDEDRLLAEAQLDNEDEDGDKLNVATDHSGEDLDVPGSELDDNDEAVGEEDEENNNYSDSDQDDNTRL